jgi:hypothetical protein
MISVSSRRSLLIPQAHWIVHVTDLEDSTGALLALFLRPSSQGGQRTVADHDVTARQERALCESS